MPTQILNKITPKRIAEAKGALESIIDAGIHCDWNSVMKTLKHFFEDLEEDIKNASHE